MAEERSLLRLAVLKDSEVTLLQAGDQPVRLINHDGVKHNRFYFFFEDVSPALIFLDRRLGILLLLCLWRGTRGRRCRRRVLREACQRNCNAPHSPTNAYP